MTKEESIRDAQSRAKKIAIMKPGVIAAGYKKNEADTLAAKKFDRPGDGTELNLYYLELYRLVPGAAGRVWQSITFEFTAPGPRDVLFDSAF